MRLRCPPDSTSKFSLAHVGVELSLFPFLLTFHPFKARTCLLLCEDQCPVMLVRFPFLWMEVLSFEQVALRCLTLKQESN